MDRTQLARAAGRPAAAIRPVSPADEAVLREFFAALSVESRYLRFFAPVTPSCGLFDLMAGKPAHVDAIVAVADGVIVGHAMAADRPVPENPVPENPVPENPVPENPVPENPGTPGGPEQPRATDVGVVVADAWQRRGVGATLMRALIDRAQARGVTTLAMDVLPGNRRVLAMIVAHWPQAAVGHAPDSVDIRIPLPQPELPQPDPRPRAARPPTGPLVQPLVQPAAAAAGKALAAVGR